MPKKNVSARVAKAGKAELRPCVFLDRDGTVSREAGYVNHPERIELLPGSGAAVRRLNEKGILAVLTTNQAGVAKGYITEEVLREIHDRLEEQLEARNAKLDGIYYAPNHPDGSVAKYRKDDDLRKPRQGMIEAACRDLPVDLARSYVVGDKVTDIEFAQRAGIKSVFVLSGYGLGAWTYQRDSWKVEADHVATDLGEAVRWILSDLRRRGNG